MPAVWRSVKFEGRKGKVEVISKLNTAADYVALPLDIAEKVGPKFLREEEIGLADGTIKKDKIFRVKIEVVDDERKVRKCETEAIIARRAYPLLSIDAMDKLRMIPDVINGKVIFR